MFFVLRKNISRAFNHAFRKNKLSKDAKTSFILNSLGYSLEELKAHIEFLFEPWMTWDNRGTYNSKIWDDNDQSTWTWQIDHIVPQSDLPYISIEDDNFKKCWSLENLRPLSSKQNILDGSSKVRHVKNRK